MRFIRVVEVMDMLAVSRTTLWRMVKAGAFPAPVQITVRSRGFVLEEVEAWMQARVDEGQPRLELRFSQTAVSAVAAARFPRESRRRFLRESRRHG